MPKWVDEEAWNRAKKLAKKQGQEKNYAYIMAIYKNIARKKMVGDELEYGKKVEKEHTSDERTAQKIAQDHLGEYDDYYTRLEAMEKQAESDKKMNEETKKVIKWLNTSKTLNVNEAEKELKIANAKLMRIIMKLAKERAMYSRKE